MDISDFLTEWSNSHDYILAHTSGSTGTPKQIRLLKSDMVKSAENTNGFFGIDANSTLALPLPVDYIAGKMMVVRSIVANCRLLEIEPSNTFQLKDRCDLISIVPSQVDWLISHGKKSENKWNEKIGHAIIGGAPLSRDRELRLVDAGFDGYCSYGMTETCSHVALRHLGEENEPYKAIKGFTFTINENDCLVIHSSGFSFGTIVTNDIVELIDSVSFRWIGRYDNIINSGGIKISPERVEAEIGSFYHKEFYITGIADEKWGERIAMVIQDDGEDVSYLLNLLYQNLDHKMLPKRVFAVKNLPRTENGKVKRLKISDLDDLV